MKKPRSSNTRRNQTKSKHKPYKTPAYLADVENLSKALEIIKNLQNEVPKYSLYVPKDKRKKTILRYTWHGLYNKPFARHLAICALCLDQQGKMLESQRDSFFKVVLSGVPSIQDYWEKECRLGKNKLAVHGAVASLIKNIESLSINSRSINALLATGKDESLLKAVKIDPSVIHSERLCLRIREAILYNHRDFLNSLGNAIKPREKEPIAGYLTPVRILIIMLFESGKLQLMTAKDRHHLFVVRLRTHLDNTNSERAPDTVDSLKRFINRVLRGHLGQ